MPKVKPKTKTHPAPMAVRQSPKQQQLPMEYGKDDNLGKEMIETQDLEIPRLKLMQGLSPELQDFDELKPGFFFHTAAEHVFDKPFRAVPVYLDKRYILWNPREAGGGILARADDGVNWSPSSGKFTVKLDRSQGGAQVTWTLAPTVAESGLARWGSQNPADPNSPPAATLMYNFLLSFPDEPDLMLAVLSFQRSSIRPARKFLTKLRTQTGPLFAGIWEFSSNLETRNNNEYYTIAVKGAGLVTDPEQRERYRQMHMQYRNIGLKVKDIESLQDEGSGDNVGEETADAPGY